MSSHAREKWLYWKKTPLYNWYGSCIACYNTFKAEAFTTTTFIINVLLSSSIHYDNPYHVFLTNNLTIISFKILVVQATLYLDHITNINLLFVPLSACLLVTILHIKTTYAYYQLLNFILVVMFYLMKMFSHFSHIFLLYLVLILIWFLLILQLLL